MDLRERHAMIKERFLVVLWVGVANLWVGGAFGQGNIENRMQRLEMRVEALERANAPAQPPQPRGNTAKHRNLQNWRSLNLGMSESQVRNLLGDPHKIDNNQFFKTWYWDYPAGPQVTFDGKSGLLNKWNEP
jgi:hypothetical protein